MTDAEAKAIALGSNRRGEDRLIDEWIEGMMEASPRFRANSEARQRELARETLFGQAAQPEEGR